MSYKQLILTLFSSYTSCYNAKFSYVICLREFSYNSFRLHSTCQLTYVRWGFSLAFSQVSMRIEVGTTYSVRLI